MRIPILLALLCAVPTAAQIPPEALRSSRYPFNTSGGYRVPAPRPLDNAVVAWRVTVVDSLAGTTMNMEERGHLNDALVAASRQQMLCQVQYRSCVVTYEVRITGQVLPQWEEVTWPPDLTTIPPIYLPPPVPRPGGAP